MALRVAIAGLGSRGRAWARHVSAVPGLTLAAGIDPAPDARAAATADTGFAAPVWPDLESAACRTPLDAVIVATDAPNHATVCADALDRGLAVLVEKPFTLSLADGRALVQRADRAGRPLLVAQNYRYLRVYRRLRELLSSGILGPLGRVGMQYFRDAHYVTPALAALESAPMWETAVHHLDAIRFAVGREARTVTARISTLPWSAGLRGTTIDVLLELDGGLPVAYSATYDSRGHEFFEKGQELYARVTGEHGTAHVVHRWILLCRRGRLPRPVWRGPRRRTEEVELLHQLEAAIVDGRPSACSGRDNLKTLAILDACARSAAEGRSVPVER